LIMAAPYRCPSASLLIQHSVRRYAIGEVCRLLRYEAPVHTSQEAHYVSATVPSRLMLCKRISRR
jgi:hypothetical protein